MKLYNLKDHNEQVSFAQAVTQGLGKQQGLFFFPHDLPEFSLTEIDEMLNRTLSAVAQRSSRHLLAMKYRSKFWKSASARGVCVPGTGSAGRKRCRLPELFHGPTLAFKDFGGRFMAQMLTHISGDKPVTILTATSGDTGAAVAHAFYGPKMCGSSFSTRAVRSVRCRKNCSVRWAATLKPWRSTAISTRAGAGETGI